MKAQILNFRTQKTGYGHWLISMEVENPAFFLSEDDYYWTFNDREDEPETLTLRTTSTNSRAIDGHDGYEVALAEECIRSTDWSEDLFDFSGLKSEEED